MILVAGGTGRLGAELVRRLTARGIQLRVLTRDPERARQRFGNAPKIVVGDVEDARSLEAALDGIDGVVSAITGFGPGGRGPGAVDAQGNLNLIRAAESARVRHFVLVSMHGTAAEHPMELLRMKHRAELALRDSRLEWTIVRPTVFMELWTGIIGDPLVKTGKTTVFGRGNNPVNFISTRDLAQVVELALFDPSLRQQTLDVGGPENVTLNGLVEQIELVAGRRARVRHVPLPVMRLSRLLLRPFKPDIAGMIEAGIAMDTVDMSFDAAELRRRFPQLGLTPVAEVIRTQILSTART